MTTTVTQTAKPGDFTYIPFAVKMFHGDRWSLMLTLTGEDITSWQVIGQVRVRSTSPVEYHDLEITPVPGDNSSVWVGEDDASGPTGGTWGVKFIPPTGGGNTRFGGPYSCLTNGPVEDD